MYIAAAVDPALEQDETAPLVELVAVVWDSLKPPSVRLVDRVQSPCDYFMWFPHLPPVFVAEVHSEMRALRTFHGSTTVSLSRTPGHLLADADTKHVQMC